MVNSILRCFWYLFLGDWLFELGIDLGTRWFCTLGCNRNVILNLIAMRNVDEKGKQNSIL
jgi:hypothetical protein